MGTDKISGSPKEKFDTVIYNKKISDDYFWMRRTANEKEMLDFSKQQGLLTQSILDGIPGTEAMDMHPAVRYTAKLQQAQKGERPILLLVDWNSGHSGSVYKLLYMLKFAFWQTGHSDFQLRMTLQNLLL